MATNQESSLELTAEGVFAYVTTERRIHGR